MARPSKLLGHSSFFVASSLCPVRKLKVCFNIVNFSFCMFLKFVSCSYHGLLLLIRNPSNLYMMGLLYVYG